MLPNEYISLTAKILTSDPLKVIWPLELYCVAAVQELHPLFETTKTKQAAELRGEHDQSVVRVHL